MAIQFFNTLSGKKEPFKSLQNGKVTMYCCGVTPYGNTHIGHSRTFFSYDLLYRTLKDQDIDVAWARNITDVDDKIINKANNENVSCSQIVSRYISEQNEMLELFNLIRPQHEPKVTETIPEIINLIENLIQKEYAYVSKSGVYYRVRKFDEYGKLSKNKINDLKVGARIEVDEAKEDALDFALWKFAKVGEIFWSSPWGDGRPGWHVECSAMIHSLFGDSIDIHMGGRDLIFPHHEAEIAQSEGASGKPLASTWLHAGMVTLYGEKMSKSTNHFVAIKDFLSKYPSEVLRLVFLSVSYGQPLDFTFELTTENLKKLARLYRFVSLVDSYAEQTNLNPSLKEFDGVIFAELSNLSFKMKEFLADDLNSNGALATFFDFIKGVNTQLARLEKLGQKLRREDSVLLKTKWPEFKNWIKNALGLLVDEPKIFFENLRKYNLGSEISAEDIELKIQERTKARSNKDWIKSDAIRDELLAQGVQIQDSPSGTKWIVLI
ncbi:cysteine--tRNA ligase [Fluviispira multicolorata]|uniref:Cysteine--tRNA ligase n=1 Tax=Fluviispira multicolorata TaxID=2654512 RepID=A0A833N6W3_9BACT|nr:cysteine--tRNA ligase [Fluviispira multicolorata]KAB8030968.1 cysteine--tRNA ligase [Fluviispira multicolorata]